MRLSENTQLQMLKMVLVGLITVIVSKESSLSSQKNYFIDTKDTPFGDGLALPDAMDAKQMLSGGGGLKKFCESSILVNLNLNKPIYKLIQFTLKLDDEEFQLVIDNERASLDFMVISNKKFYCNFYNNILEYAETRQLDRELSNEIAHKSDVVEIQKLEEKKLVINESIQLLLQSSMIFILLYFVAKVYELRRNRLYSEDKAREKFDQISPNSRHSRDNLPTLTVTPFNGDSKDFRRESYRSEE